MKNSKLFLTLTCIIPALLISCMVNLKAQNDLTGYTYLGSLPDAGWVAHYYYLSNCEASWEEANEAATEMGGYLVTLSDGYEYYILWYTLQWITGVHDVWIGLRGVNGIYEWANGEPQGFCCNWGYYPDPYPVYEPIYADGAALWRAPYGDWEYGNFLASYPVSGEFKYIVEFNTPPDCNTNNPNKTYICHNGNTICVNISSLQAHLDHGDLEGPCGPCNTPAMQILPDDGSEIDGHAIHEEKVRLSIPEKELDIAQDKMILDQIQVSPNPASAEIHIVLPGEHHEGVLRILSLTGQELQTFQLTGQQTIVLDLSAYASELYLVDVRSVHGHYQKKFVKL